MIEKHKLLREQLDKLNLKFGIRHTGVFILSIVLSYLVTQNLIISMVGAFVPLLYFLMPKEDVKLQPVHQALMLYLTVALVAFLGAFATVNVISTILLNTIVPFVVVSILYDEKNIYGYAVYYAVFIYVQFMNITLENFHMYLISAFIGVVVAYVSYEFIWNEYGKFNNANTISNKNMVLRKIKLIKRKLKNSFNLDNSTARFAIRISIVTALTITFCSMFNLTEMYWLPKATCFTLVPMWSQINARAVKRFRSTVIGCILYFLFTLLMPNRFVYFVVVILALVLALSYLPKKYLAEYYTLSTFVSISLISESNIGYLMSKVTYVLIGVFIAVLVNQFVMSKKIAKISVYET